jgi:hypothetical protein
MIDKLCFFAKYACVCQEFCSMDVDEPIYQKDSRRDTTLAQ